MKRWSKVISGKIDTGGLLKQKKKNYNEIAVNKLLDVLRKDPPKSEEDEKIPFAVDLEEDDWIGGKNGQFRENPARRIKASYSEA